MARHEEEVEITGVIYNQTDKAVLFSDVGDKENAIWIAKSQIRECYPNYVGKIKEFDCVITIPEWIAYENELI